MRELSVTYLEGSALNDNDLRRAKVETALGIFIMTDKFSTNPDEQDSKSILQEFTIRRYIVSKMQSVCDVMFFMQLIRPENKRHLVICK